MKHLYALAIIIAGFYFPSLTAAQTPQAAQTGQTAHAPQATQSPQAAQTPQAAPSPQTAQTDEIQQHADSLRAVIAATEGEEKLKAYEELADYLYVRDNNPENLITMLADHEREALRQGNKKVAASARSNTITVRNQHNLYEQLLENAESDLEFIARQEAWNTYFDAYYTVVEACYMDGQHDRAMEEAIKCSEQAKRIGTPYAKASSLFLMGYLYAWNNRYNDALNFFGEAIREAGNHYECNNIKQKVYGYSMQIYYNQDKTEELGNLLAEWEAEINKLETGGESVAHLKINLYGGYARYYLRTKEFDKMEEYSKLIESISVYPHDLNTLHHYRKEAAIARGDYELAMEHVNALYEYAEKQGDRYGKHTALRERARIEILWGKKEESLATLERVFDLRDSISDMEFNVRLDELRTQYEVDRHVTEKERNRNYFLFALGCCLLLAVVLGIYVYYSRKIVRKNRELVRKAQQWANVEPALVIGDRDMVNSEMVDRDTDEQPQKDPQDSQEAQESQSKTTEPDEVDKALFAEIELLIDRGLYVESSLSLDMLAGKTKQNPTYISKAISHCTGKTFKVWLNEYRIKEAIRLLSDKKNPNISIDDLTFESGFNDRTTFYRVFKKMTGLSPTDFKKNGLGK